MAILARLGLLLACQLVVVPPTIGLAQAADPAPSTSGIPKWVTFSAGFGTPPRIALLLSASVKTRPALLSLRLAGNFARHDGPSESDLALLAMRATRGRHLRAMLGAGIALVSVDDGSRGIFHPINRRTLAGLPLEVQGLWCPDREIGLSLTGFANVNHRRSFAGITLGIVWGVFWVGARQRGS
jgi:hypothetical protein